MQIKTDPWVVGWFKALAIKEGYQYRGSAQLGKFLTAIAQGKYRIVKIEVDNQK